MKIVRIANGQAFWGDRVDAPVELVRRGGIDYLTMDYLAELTMSIMKKQKLSNPDEGYARDFITLMKEILPTCMEKNIKIVTNAGGLNPEGCRAALLSLAAELDIHDLKIGTVSGDDIYEQLPEIYDPQQAPLNNLETDQLFTDVKDRIMSANAYLGAFPIANLLDQGAHIVLTGRCSDPSLVLGPLAHEFQWQPNDWDKLAAGTVAGHLIECGAQATGGNFQGGWEEIEDLVHIGYPIVEVQENGEFVITKHEGTGGLVNTHTVSEQLLYELGDPKKYISPDVIVDFTQVELLDEAPNRVRVTGASGKPCTPFYKVSMSYEDGYITQGMLSYGWPHPVKKAQKADEMIRQRIHELNLQFDEIHTDYIGVNGVHGPLSPVMKEEPNDCVFRVAVRGPKKSDHVRFGMELAPLIMGPSGATGFVGGRPKPSKVIAYWPSLVPKEAIHINISLEEIK